MIKRIHLKNFQGHGDTMIELSSGVNVITGQSDVGKSSVVRALRWLILNRPSGGGDLFRRHGSGEKSTVSVEIGLDDEVSILRFRGAKNGYTVGDKTLVAIRTDVPTEVSDLLNFGPQNLQTQHQPYFLLMDSPGDVARKLNEVCGLDVIDDCLSNGALLVSRNSQQIKERALRISDLEESEAKYSDLDARSSAVLDLEAMEKKALQMRQKCEELQVLVDIGARTQADLQDIDKFLLVEKPADALFKILESRNELQIKLDQLTELVETYRRQDREVVRLDAEIVDMEDEFHSIFITEGVCPLCGQEVK